jgi:hypothetical protein
MSTTIGYGLRTRKADDFEQMAAYATKLTSEWSLKELGYDMTIRDEEREEKEGFYYQGYCVEENQVIWNDFSGSRKNIPIDDILAQIATHFPEMELLFWRSWEGPVDYECSIKNGEVTEIQPYGLCLYIENEEDFCRLADRVQKEEWKAPYYIEKVIVKEDQCIAILYFDSLSQEDSERAMNGIMDEITKLLPLSDFYCFFFENNEMGDRIERKALVRNGVAEWQDVPKKDDRPVFYQDYDEENPFAEDITAEVFKSIIENRTAPVVELDIEDSAESDVLPF